MSDAGENGDSAMPGYFDAVSQTADTAPADGLGDWSGIINPNYLTEPVFTEDQLAAVRALPELAGLGVDLTQPPPDYLAGTGLTADYAGFDFSQHNPSLWDGPIGGPAASTIPAPGGGQVGISDGVWRPGQAVTFDTGNPPLSALAGPHQAPLVAAKIQTAPQGGGLDISTMSPADIQNSAVVTGKNAPTPQQPKPAPQAQQGLQPSTLDALDRADPVTAPFAQPKPIAPLMPQSGQAVQSDAPSIAAGSMGTSMPLPGGTENNTGMNISDIDPSQTEVRSGINDPAVQSQYYPDPQKDTININGKTIPRLQAALNVNVTDDEAKTILDAADGDPDIARRVEAIARIENVGNGHLATGQTSKAGTVGPLQISPAVWQHYRGTAPLSGANNLGDAARVAAQYIRDVEKARKTNDPAVVAADYMGGPPASKAVARGDIPDGTQTQQYVRMMRGVMRDMPVRQ